MNKRGFTAHSIEIQRVIKDYFDNLYATEQENLEEINTFHTTETFQL